MPSDLPTPPNTSSCSWERLAISASACTDFSESGILTRCGSENQLEHATERAPVYRCSARGDARTRSFLVGPFQSRVQQWHSIVASVPLLQRGDRIVHYTGDTVSARDASTPIGYPPLHMHHIHVHHLEDSDHWFETHGDYARAGDAHFDYSLASPPPGCCVVMDHSEPLLVSAQLNDVRFSTNWGGTAMAGGSNLAPTVANEMRAQESLGMMPPCTATSTPGVYRTPGGHSCSPSYSWYFRIAFEIEQPTPPMPTATSSAAAATPCRPVHKLVLGFPLDAHAQNDPLRRFDAGNRETVFVWSHKLPYGGSVVTPSHSHIHRARHGGHLLIRGQHSLEGLTGTSIDALRSSLLPQTDRIAALRSLVLERARADGTLLCHDDESQPTFVHLPEHGDGHGGHHDRQGSFVCEPFAFEAGELVTVVLFSKPVWALELELFPQHAQIFLYYEPAHTRADNGAVFSAPLVQMVSIHGYPNGYTLTDLDGALGADARSLRCIQPPTEELAPSVLDMLTSRSRGSSLLCALRESFCETRGPWSALIKCEAAE